MRLLPTHLPTNPRRNKMNEVEMTDVLNQLLTDAFLEHRISEEQYDAISEYLEKQDEKDL